MGVGSIVAGMKKISILPLSILLTIANIDKIAAQNLYVGNNSSGTTETFSEGTNFFENTYIGLNSADSRNILFLQNSGTLLSNNQTLYTGYWGGSNQLVVSNGAKLTTGVLSVGQHSISNSAFFTGTTTVISNAGELVIGNTGGAALNNVTISGGAYLLSADTKVGWEGSSNSVLATGIDTVWDNIGAVAVGQFGAGNSVSVSDGARVYSSALNIGIYSLSNSASISGNGSSWQVGSNGIVVGVAGYGHQLSFSNGAQLTNSGAAQIGWEGATNTVTVSGPNTVWSNAGHVSVGHFGAGNSVSVSDGAKVYSRSSTVSATASASNSRVVIDGAGSHWITGGPFVVGSSPGTLLQVINGGRVTAKDVFVGAGATISGDGNVEAAVVISTDASLSPGAPIGKLTIEGDLALDAGGSYDWQLSNNSQAVGVSSDTVEVSGTLDLSKLSENKVFHINLSTLSSTTPAVSGGATAFNSNVSCSWTLFRATDGIIGFNANTFYLNVAATNGSGGFVNATAPGSVFYLDVDGNDLKLIYTVPPIDSDGDGLTDEVEVLLSSLGFDPFVNNASQVISLFVDPNNSYLFTQSQFDGNRTAGQSDVLNNPAGYNLYTSNSIMDLRMGGLMLQKQGSNAVVTFQTQTTTDLATQPFTNNGTAITNTIPMPSNKGFLRMWIRDSTPPPTPL